MIKNLYLSGSKFSEWAGRYLPAEIAGITGALIGGLAANRLFGNYAAAALGGTWGENIFYYGQILITDLAAANSKNKTPKKGKSWRVFRNILVEFGPAECLDSFLVRPAAMYLPSGITENATLGILSGKITADIIFYIPAILGYEFRRKFLH